MLVALATKHEKEKIFAPILSKVGWELKLSAIDTDEFGTFAGEVERKLSPAETAIAKARAAAVDARLSVAMASEGAIAPHPQIPFINADFEWVAFVDLSTGLEVVESIVGSEIVAIQAKYQEGMDLTELAVKAQLPGHALIAKAQSDSGVWVVKGLRSASELEGAIAQAKELGLIETLVFESDFRAMCSPSRQENIRKCLEKLMERLSVSCPSCQSIGFGLVGVERGVPCSDCGEILTSAVRAEVHGCLLCSHREVRENGIRTISPDRCLVCNP